MREKPEGERGIGCVVVVHTYADEDDVPPALFGPYCQHPNYAYVVAQGDDEY